MSVNYVGHFLLTHLLMPQLKAAVNNNNNENARVVNVTSCVHEIGIINLDDFEYKNYYRAGMVYTDSKLAQVMFTRHLQKLCDENSWPIQIHAAHPGMANTDIFSASVLGPLSNYPITRHWFKVTFFSIPFNCFILSSFRLPNELHEQSSTQRSLHWSNVKAELI